MRHGGLFVDVYDVGVKSVSSQEVRGALLSASSENLLPTRCLFGTLEETEVTGGRIGAAGALVHKLLAAASKPLTELVASMTP